MSGLSKKITGLYDLKEPVRLNKFMSDAGFCSRREADRLIESGKVKIDGKVAKLGSKVLAGQEVSCDGKILRRNEKMILIAFNKPEGIECTTDRSNPDNIIDFINYPERIYPVGRLDKASVGLILLTNTGEIVNKILKASNYHEKEYEVTVRQKISDVFIRSMSAGVKIGDVTTRPCKVKRIDPHTFSIILTQGLNRQIRRMCEALGCDVIALKRVRIMNISLSNLPMGHFRHLSDEEIKKLLKECGL